MLLPFLSLQRGEISFPRTNKEKSLSLLLSPCEEERRLIYVDQLAFHSPWMIYQWLSID